MTIKEITLEYLKANGFDGLSCDTCRCFIDDLMPCDGLGVPRTDCTPGYRIPCPNPDECDCEGKMPHIGVKPWPT